MPLQFASVVGSKGLQKLVFQIPFLTLLNEVMVPRFHGGGGGDLWVKMFNAYKFHPLLKIFNVM